MKIFLVISILFSVFQVGAQTIINAYAKVTGIAGTTLTVNNADQNYHDFIVGEYVVIMQMQDSISFTITNSNSFGNLTSSTNINNAGKYEVRKIIGINGNFNIGYITTSILNIQLDQAPNTYNFSSNSSVQIITFRYMPTAPSIDYTSQNDITALPWNGDIGGVIAMEIPGEFTVSHAISANGVGFRGGNRSDRVSTSCSLILSAIYGDASSNYGQKGETFYKNGTAAYTRARAKLLTGGGGATCETRGGGGGGNYSPGGFGDGCGDNDYCYGFGGIGLGNTLGASRVLLGGGGGGGHRESNTLNSTNGPGANGGGIILIKAAKLRRTCNGSITANGSASNDSNDGAGGAGAGGCIVLEVPILDIYDISGCGDFNIQANGGDGGNGDGEGGAGGQGMIVYTANVITDLGQITFETNPGNGDENQQNAPGSSDLGVIGLNSSFNTPLPVTLTYFNAVLSENETVQLSWQTAAEINSAYFTLERSINGVSWEEIGKVNAAGNSTEEINYSFQDKRPFDGVSYYRLSQTDLDGQTKDLGIRSILRDGEEIIVFPNPAVGRIEFQGPIGSFEYVALYDVLGNNIMSSVSFDQVSERQLTLNIDPLESGIYFLKTKDSIIRFVKKQH
ncbi:MAG: T9SS type A sorting domain-containing protein [Crocinitomicaceae bacterium]